MILEYLREHFDPRHKRHENFVLIHETTPEEKERNHGRLPDRIWMVLFPHAGAAMPYAIVDEWDDGRVATDLTDDGQEITRQTLDFWYGAQRRMGDH